LALGEFSVAVHCVAISVSTQTLTLINIQEMPIMIIIIIIICHLQVGGTLSPVHAIYFAKDHIRIVLRIAMEIFPNTL